MGVRNGDSLEEIWKDVVGYEGYYEVSNYGNVRALDRTITRSDGVQYTRVSQIMSQTINDDGYPTVKLSKDGKSTRITVHRLVAIAFVENPDCLPEVNHIDFNRQNAKASNLEWISHKDNIHYTIKAGRHHCNLDLTGNKNPNYKNTTLKEFYQNHPEEKKKLSRKGSQNGMAKSVEAELPDGRRIQFDYLRECANYLIERGMCNTKNLNTVADKIAKSIKNNEPYCDCHFSRV